MYTNDFERIFKEHRGNIIHKWSHYFEIYDRHFRKFRNKKIILLEVGVYKGGSLDLWRKYFGPDLEIVAIDIIPECKKFEDENTKIYIGSQEDRNFLRELKKQIPKVDILIDDGGHMMDQLRITFEELYDWVSEDGVYLVEDLHTCYWSVYEGGYKRKKSFIEYTKNLIDKLNAWHSQTGRLVVDDFTKSTHSMHYYDSILVFEKRKMEKPFDIIVGTVDSEEIESAPPKIKNWWKNLKNKIYQYARIDI